MALRLDYTNMLAEYVPGGIPRAALAGATDLFARAMAVLDERRGRGELGFLDLPAAHDSTQQILRFAEGAGQAFSDIVVLGIGGSALGPIALRSALRSIRWNELGDEARDYFPRMHVLENVDPVTIGELLGRIELGRTLFLVVSKSGGTAETMAQYLVVRGRLIDALGDNFRRHLVFVTDPEKGSLRRIAREESIPALDIPSNVGGRFSVMSAVGLLPAALIGIDIQALMAGAGDMAERCGARELLRNPAAMYAILQWMADARHGLGTHVIMPYTDNLRDVGDWFVQLWAESLGKIRADGTSVGPTPIPALGATDQHSQVQLFMEGPLDKTVTFITVAAGTADIQIPSLHPDVPELAYLGGHSLGELLDIERRATAGALARRGRPNMTITLDTRDAWHVGSLLMMLAIATVVAGALYEVNPLDQPGVELGKRYTYAMLGRPDARDARQEWDALPKPDPRAIV
ncbi:MAG TPA: glucose-6-phosphate isomerase [Gemmatimonadaceae bacterium]|nr:glucose-6-phosphate isomerase [Gemmatimonadaceae bacterium]